VRLRNVRTSFFRVALASRWLSLPFHLRRVPYSRWTRLRCDSPSWRQRPG
jgi:hypothetical protein